MDFDSIDEKTAFKLGFAHKCFEMGLEPEHVKEAMEKSASWARILPYLDPRKLGPLLSAGWKSLPSARTAGRMARDAGLGLGGAAYGLGASGLFNAAKDYSGLILGLGGAAGLAGGAALGYGKAKLDEKEVDEDEIKSKELADTYKVYADRLKAQKAYRQYRQARGMA